MVDKMVTSGRKATKSAIPAAIKSKSPSPFRKYGAVAAPMTASVTKFD